MPLTPEFYVTISIFAAGLVIAAGMVILERRPKDGLSVSLIPTTPILYVCVFISMLAAVHLLNLLGVQTGR